MLDGKGAVWDDTYDQFGQRGAHVRATEPAAPAARCVRCGVRFHPNHNYKCRRHKGAWQPRPRRVLHAGRAAPLSVGRARLPPCDAHCRVTGAHDDFRFTKPVANLSGFIARKSRNTPDPGSRHIGPWTASGREGRAARESRRARETSCLGRVAQLSAAGVQPNASGLLTPARQLLITIARRSQVCVPGD